MNELIIETTDPTFIEDIRKLNKIGFIEVHEPMAKASEPNSISTAIEITIKILSPIAGALIIKWLKNRFRKPTSGKTTINNQTITNEINIENLQITINNIYPQNEKPK